ncbi:MAG: GAF domain-containing protein, partial [Dehalococcoidia bacterium]|nr:GAF domain-containing protein [Dehalococcoidia bacterium]
MARDAQQQLAVVNKLMAIIASNLNINKVFKDFVDELRKAVDVDWASIVLIRDKEICFYALSSKIGSAWKAGDIVSIEGTGAAWLAATKKALVEPDLAQEQRFWPDEYHHKQGVRSIVYLPLLASGKVFGTLIVASTHPNAYREKELGLLEQLCTQIAGAIRAGQLYQLEKGQRVKLEKERGERLQFINALAHELKTPLTSIVASGGLLLEELNEEAQSPRVRLVENMLSATNKLEARLSELLDMAKMESPGFKLTLELLDIRLLLQNMASELLPVAAGKRQSLTLDIPPSVPMVKADKQRLEQVLLNLVSN